MILPENKHFPIHKLSAVFNNTSATYKFYWFISFLEIFNDKSEPKIPLKHILARMICNAWYPVHYFKLSFGLSDLLSQNIKIIQKITNTPIDADKNDLYNFLITNKDNNLEKLIMHFEKQVPFRFLSPWFPGADNKKIIELSKTFNNGCLYKLNWDQEKTIEVNPLWLNYLKLNFKILLDFSFWNLSVFLQSKNPNVPDIPNKLIKPVKRSSLINQRKFWNLIFESNTKISCIYTGRNLTKGDFAIEHFMPYSFVSHDQLWNLIPADSCINSSKSNKLPDLNFYLEAFTHLQRLGLETVYQQQPNSKLLEDFLILGASIPDILKMNFSDFKDKYYDILSPILQIARNMGFHFWEYYPENR